MEANEEGDGNPQAKKRKRRSLYSAGFGRILKTDEKKKKGKYSISVKGDYFDYFLLFL